MRHPVRKLRDVAQIQPPIGLFMRLDDVQAVHADHRPRRIGKAYLVVDVAQPDRRLGARLDVAEPARLVATLPGGYRLLALEGIHEALNEPGLPFERDRVGLRIAVLERRRQEEPERHVAREDRDDELHAVALGHVAELGEAHEHSLVHAGPSGGRVGERQLVKRETRLFLVRKAVARSMYLDDGLEVAPSREHPKHGDTVRLQRGEVLFDALGPPVAPHPRGGLARPVVDAELEASVLEKRPTRGVRGKCAAGANRRDGQHYRVS